MLEKDVEFQKDITEIQGQKKKAEAALQALQTDENAQNTDLEKRIAERKRRIALNRSTVTADGINTRSKRLKNKSFLVPPAP